MKIDFEQYHIVTPSVIYMHPDQVHRILSFENVSRVSWAMTDENLRPEYLHTLQDIAPAKAVLLDGLNFDLIAEATTQV